MLVRPNYFFVKFAGLQIAQELDALERQFFEGGASLGPNDVGNVAADGMFSVQVLEKALEVWNLQALNREKPEVGRTCAKHSLLRCSGQLWRQLFWSNRHQRVFLYVMAFERCDVPFHSLLTVVGFAAVVWIEHHAAVKQPQVTNIQGVALSHALNIIFSSNH